MKRNVHYDTNESVGFLLSVASMSMRLHLNRRFTAAGYEVSTEQWRLMMAVWQQEGQTQKQLAEKCFKNKVSITKLLDNLEKQGLVYREQSRDDRRGNCVHLTEEGTRMQEELILLAKENLRQAEQGIDPQDLETFKAVTRRIIANMKP